MYPGAASVLDEQQETVPQQWQPQAKGVGDAFAVVAVVPLPLDPVGTPRRCGADASGVEGHSRMNARVLPSVTRDRSWRREQRIRTSRG